MIQPDTNVKTTRKCRPISERLAANLDKRLLSLMKRGRPALAPTTGCPRSGKDGKAIMVPPSSSDISSALKRVEQLKAAPSELGSKSHEDELARQLRLITEG